MPRVEVAGNCSSSPALKRRLLVVAAFAAVMAGCQTGPRSAPVVDRTVNAKEPSMPSQSGTRAKPLQSKAADATAKSTPSEDWRPEYYAVKKGDTLYAISLDHGLDYRELASWNGISDPNRILVGQKLRLKPTDSKTAGESKPAAEPRSATEARPATAPKAVAPEPEASPAVSRALDEKPLPAGEALPAAVALKSEPQAQRIPYSDEAYARLFGTEAPRAESKDSAVNPAVKAQGDSPVKAEVANTNAKASDKANDKEPVFDAARWLWPTQAGAVVASFDGSRQKGVVIAGRQGDAVMAANGGKVVYSGKAIQSYGNLIIVKHDGDYLSVYAHNAVILVKEGQRVSAGQKIAEMGERAPGQVALHFEIRKLGQPVDPAKLLPPR